MLESRQDELARNADFGTFYNQKSRSTTQRRINPEMTKNMAQTTKLKLAKLAKKFFSRKGISGKKGLPNLSPGTRAGQESLLEDDELAHSTNGQHLQNDYSSTYSRY